MKEVEIFETFEELKRAEIQHQEVSLENNQEVAEFIQLLRQNSAEQVKTRKSKNKRVR